MTLSDTTTLTVISRWTARPGMEQDAATALIGLGDTPGFGPQAHSVSQDPDAPRRLVVIERWENPAAFEASRASAVWADFLAIAAPLFMSLTPETEQLTPVAGEPRRPNLHPPVMFEIMARDQASLVAYYRDVFGWSFDYGEPQDGTRFAYVHFLHDGASLLGGIGQAQALPPQDGMPPATGTGANPGGWVPGMAPGKAIYLQVDSLDRALGRCVAFGGEVLMPAVAVDGYRFAMFTDPEGNAMGVIEPFSGRPD